MRGGIALLVVVGFGTVGLAQPEAARVDPDVMPAQFVAGPTALVQDPPTPTIRLQVRTPATVAPGQPIPYKFIVSNVSAADAYKVTLRCPVPMTIAEVSKAEPKPDRVDPKPTNPKGELIWVLGTMKAGARQEIEVQFKPTPETKEVSTAAYITYESGQAVVTKIDKPKLTVQKQAPEKAAQGETFGIRVIVSNTGKVPLKNVELIEDISPTFQYVGNSVAEAERSNKPTQRIWKLGTLGPGQRQVIEYGVKTDQTADLLAQSIVRSSDITGQEEATRTTKILTSAFTVDLTGPGVVNTSDPAKYEVKVTNTGTLPLRDLRVVAYLPNDCSFSSMTEGGKRYRDAIVWIIPDAAGGPLQPGQAYTVRFGLRAGSSGLRTVKATVDGPRDQTTTKELKTNFEGSAQLRWSATASPIQVVQGRNGTVTVKVQNTGTEPARNVRLRMELPPEVQIVEVTPKYRLDNGEIAFDPRNLAANDTETFTLTYKAARPGRTIIKMKLYAEGYDKEPLRKEQELLINP